MLTAWASQSAIMMAMVSRISTSRSTRHSILYHNNGDGTFTDVTAKAGVAAPGWATSAVWFDYDNDGRLDLFVCHFVDYSKTKLKFCGDLLTGERHLLHSQHLRSDAVLAVSQQR